MQQAQHVNYARLKWLTQHLLGRRVAALLPDRAHVPEPKALSEAGPVIPIEKRKDLSPEEFRRVYLRRGVPVVFQGAARHWNCVHNWSLDWLSETYGDDTIHLIDAAPQNILDIEYASAETTLGSMLEALREDPIKNYSRFNRLLYEHPELKADLDLKWLKACRNHFASGQTLQVFIGGAGSKTHLHAAAEHNLFTQVFGRKHWILYPPSYDGVLRPPVHRTPYFHSPFDPENPDWEHFPELQSLPRWECTLEAGDILFNPPSWWHYVSNPTDSIGIGFRWFAAQAFQVDWCQALLTLLAVNPPIWSASLNRDNFPKIFAAMQGKAEKQASKKASKKTAISSRTSKPHD